MKQTGKLRAQLASKKVGTVLVLLANLSFVLSCGYHLAGRGQLPEGIRSLRFAPFQNKTSIPGIEKEVELALKSVLRERGRWNVIDGTQGGGEAVLSGTVVNFESRPITFSGKDFAAEYATTVTVDLSLVRESDGKMIWNRKGMRHEQTYGVVPEVVVTGSPQFRRETLNAANLASFTEISLAETQRRAAQSRILESLAEDVYQSLTARF
jgi:hypothetical protein